MAQELLKKYEKEMDEFEDWITNHPKLPKNLGKVSNMK